MGAHRKALFSPKLAADDADKDRDEIQEVMRFSIREKSASATENVFRSYITALQ